MAEFDHDWNDWHEYLMKEIEHYELSEKENTYMNMYGCTVQDMQDMMYEDKPYMLAMCILSDAQEVMEYNTEQARQFINKAKYVLRSWNNDNTQIAQEQSYG